MAVAAVARRGVEIAGKTRICTRIAHVGSEYRRVLTLDACELCIADWAVGAIGIPFEFTDVDTGATWQTTIPTLHVGPWNGIWEVRVNLFALSKALPHVTLTVDARRLADARGRARIALAILESAEALDHASAIVDRLDGAYIHNDDWDEEGPPWLSWVGKRTPTPGGVPSPRARPTRMTQPRPRVDEAGAVSRGRGAPGVGGQCGRYSQATPSLSRSRRGL